jgi:hypothetical protein
MADEEKSKVGASQLKNDAPKVVEDINSLSNKLSAKELAVLDKSDLERAISLRSQLSWEEDAKHIFRDEDIQRKRHEAMLAEMDARDNDEALKRRAEEAEKAKAEEIKNLDESLAYLVQEQEDLKLRQAETANEIKRLQSLRKGG